MLREALPDGPGPRPLWLWDEAVRSRWPFAALVGADLPEGLAGDGSQLLVRPAILGFIAICAIIAGWPSRSRPSP